MIRIARRLYAQDPLAVDLDNTVYALDSTTIDLCLSVFPWASFRETKAAIKLHTLLDLRGAIPTFILISDGKLHDVNVLDILHQAGAFFVTRAKSNFRFKRIYSCPVDRASGLICDQHVELTGFYSKQSYPDRLRRVRFKEPETDKTLVFLTNPMGISAASVCALYKSRWQVELFFKWIKQHLRIKRFFGTSENAVKSQVWIAVATYVLVAIIKKRLNLDLSLHAMLQILSVTPFEKAPLFQLLIEMAPLDNMNDSDKQLTLL